jgi:hypothetical protein
MDAQTDMMKLTVTFCSSSNVPNKTFTTAVKQFFFIFNHTNVEKNNVMRISSEPHPVQAITEQKQQKNV